MNKRLILCADGTWDNPEQTDQGMPSPSNVFKMAAAVVPFDKNGMTQMVCYHAGVGTRGGLIDHWAGGALGLGLSRIIRDLYLFLVLNYAPGDELFLFGFSRGAYTVRSLAGLIRNSGILKDNYVENYQEAYMLYRNRTNECYPGGARAKAFRNQYSWPDFKIKFIGVWDTVGALGIPIPFRIGQEQLEFHDVELSSHVDYAYQALAIDEQRKSFVPCLWTKQPTSPKMQVLEQAWFPGVHCNIGGGYQEDGLSNCTLDWMWQRAVACGLELDTYQKPLANPDGILRNSMTLAYRLLGRKIRTLGMMLPTSNELLSKAALERTNYNPENMRIFFENNPHLVSDQELSPRKNVKTDGTLTSLI